MINVTNEATHAKTGDIPEPQQNETDCLHDIIVVNFNED